MSHDQALDLRPHILVLSFHREANLSFGPNEMVRVASLTIDKPAHLITNNKIVQLNPHKLFNQHWYIERLVGLADNLIVVENCIDNLVDHFRDFDVPLLSHV